MWPFHLTYDIPITGVVQLVLLVWGLIKGIRYIDRMDERLAVLWEAMNGEGPQDPDSFFNRFNKVEDKVNQIWKRLNFDNLR